jgi:hypothetical protein
MPSLSFSGLLSIGEKVRRENALDFSGCNSRPQTGALDPVANATSGFDVLKGAFFHNGLIVVLTYRHRGVLESTVAALAIQDAGMRARTMHSPPAAISPHENMGCPVQ